jgi:hypothetical protein
VSRVVQGALSQVEKILPLLDEYRAISLLETIVNIEPKILTLAAVGVLAADGVLIAAVPDSSTELIALQVVLTILALALSAPLFIGAQLNTLIQGTTPISVAIPKSSQSAAKSSQSAPKGSRQGTTPISVAIPKSSQSAAKSSQSAPKGSRPSSSQRPIPAERAVEFGIFERLIGD